MVIVPLATELQLLLSPTVFRFHIEHEINPERSVH